MSRFYLIPDKGSQSHICLAVRFGSHPYINLHIQIKQWTNPNLTDKQIWLWDEVKTWRSSRRRSRSSTLNILCTDAFSGEKKLRQLKFEADLWAAAANPGRGARTTCLRESWATAGQEKGERPTVNCVWKSAKHDIGARGGRSEGRDGWNVSSAEPAILHKTTFDHCDSSDW